MTDYDRETVRETTVVDQVPADPYVPETAVSSSVRTTETVARPAGPNRWRRPPGS